MSKWEVLTCRYLDDNAGLFSGPDMINQKTSHMNINNVFVVTATGITLTPLLLTLLFSDMTVLTRLFLELTEFFTPFPWMVLAASGIFHDVSSFAHAAILWLFQLRWTGCLMDFFTLTPHSTLLSFLAVSQALPSLAGSRAVLDLEGSYSLDYYSCWREMPRHSSKNTI